MNVRSDGAHHASRRMVFANPRRSNGTTTWCMLLPIDVGSLAPLHLAPSKAELCRHSTQGTRGIARSSGRLDHVDFAADGRAVCDREARTVDVARDRTGHLNFHFFARRHVACDAAL